MEMQNSDVQNRADCHRPLHTILLEKFNRLPAAKISGDEIFQKIEPLDMRAIRAKVIPWMKEQGYFRNDYKNGDTGWNNIMITPHGVDNGLQHGAGPDKIQTFAALPQIIENGILVKTKPGKSNQHNIKEHIFVSKADINRKSMVVGSIVKEAPNGKRYSDHELAEIKSLDELPSQVGVNGPDTRKAVRIRQDSIMKIIHDAINVNTQDKKNADNV
jgi:hypothetical protein